MTTLRHLFVEYALFVGLLLCSALGHCLFPYLFPHRSAEIRLAVTDRESGRTSVAIQIVAAKPKPKLELAEVVEPVRPKEPPKPSEMPLVKRERPPERIVAAELPNPDAPPVAAPLPPPPVEKIDDEQPPDDKPPEPRKRKQAAAKVPVIETIETDAEVSIMTKEERGVDRPARSRHKLEPTYPASLKQRNIQGSLVLKARIDEFGKARDIVVLRSSGYADFDDSALEAVRAAGFEPAMLDDKPVSQEVTIPISFTLRRR